MCASLNVMHSSGLVHSRRVRLLYLFSSYQLTRHRDGQSSFGLKHGRETKELSQSQQNGLVLKAGGGGDACMSLNQTFIWYMFILYGNICSYLFRFACICLHTTTSYRHMHVWFVYVHKYIYTFMNCYQCVHTFTKVMLLIISPKYVYIAL